MERNNGWIVIFRFQWKASENNMLRLKTYRGNVVSIDGAMDGHAN
jgi:hypothetical protein